MLRLEPVTENNFKDIPILCRRCLYWQTQDDFDAKSMTEEVERKKLRSLLQIEKTEHSSGLIAYQDSGPVGFVHCGRPEFFPNTREYRSAPPREDAAFIACLYISQKENRNKGVGTLILETVLAELKKQGFRAVETFARKSSADNPSGPLEFYLRHGFKIKRNDSDFPLVRLELK